ncbi:MAG: ComEC/Rec2 family competence protein [Phycisphaeraceae bacterium]|nr:ComEC/Rec2 family competence protein [Phycisphaeraceae bacterium]MCB9847105.1 ComEC/Rec2 family competence protein [Phycisphaeraceae bacterium]
MPTAPSEPAPTPTRAVAAFACLALGMTPALHPAIRATIPQITPAAPLLTALLLALIALRTPPRARTSLLALAAIALGLGWATLRTTHTPRDFLGARIDPASPPIITVEGVVVTQPETGPASRVGALARFAPPITVTRFTLDADTLISSPAAVERAAGSLRVRIDEPAPGVRLGDRIRITGTALPIAAPTNPGQPDFRPRAIQDRIAGTLLVPTPGLIEPATTKPSRFLGVTTAFLRARAGAQRFIRGWIASAAGDDGNARALLGAILLGERDGEARELNSAFARIGLAHLLAISGLHLVAIAWGALLLLRLLGDRPRLETTIVILAVLAYCFIAPVRTPILRAAIMVLALLAAELAGRRYHPLAVLALTAGAIILWKPTELAAVGFQLSFGVVAALIVCTPRLERRLFPYDPPPDERTTRQLVAQRCRRLLLAALVALAIATPLVAQRIGVVSPLAPLLTALLAPPVTLLLTGAFAAILLGAVVPPIAAITGSLLALLAAAIAGVAVFADSLPFSVIHVPGVSALWTIGATLVIGWWLCVGDRANRGAQLASLLMIAWTAFAIAPPRLDRRVEARIDALDVGDGSCLLLRSGDHALLIDAGSDYPGAGLRTLPRALRVLGAGRVRTAVITHANLDHYNALPDLAEPLGLRRVLVSRHFLADAEDDPDGPTAALLNDLRRARVEVQPIASGDTIPLGELSAEVLWPPDPSPFTDANDNSVVLRLVAPTDAGDRAIIITGDIERPAMERLFADHPGLRADISEAPHHGSAVTGAAFFIQRASPGVVLQSTGPSRLDDPRLDDVRQGRTWLVTARDGALWAAINRGGKITTGSFVNPRPEPGPGSSPTP